MENKKEKEIKVEEKQETSRVNEMKVEEKETSREKEIKGEEKQETSKEKETSREKEIKGEEKSQQKKHNQQRIEILRNFRTNVKECKIHPSNRPVKQIHYKGNKYNKFNVFMSDIQKININKKRKKSKYNLDELAKNIKKFLY